ncbi:MAG: hypothetical protein Q7J54_07920 [Candidatus Woesearchaeota archaeon]|nr:hypothetical protein [Candidatus Woesearchaeota archaeon]
MANQEELDAIKIYERASSDIRREEDVLFRELNVEYESFNDIFKALAFGMKEIYDPNIYFNYKRLKGEKRLNCLTHVDLGLLVMDKALSLKPDGMIGKEEYLAAVREAYNEVGFENVEILLGIDDLSLELEKTIEEERLRPSEHRNNIVTTIYKRFFEYITNSSL